MGEKATTTILVSSLFPRVTLTDPVALESNQVITHTGIVREAHSISLGFKTAGQIKRIFVEEGDSVQQGTLLAGLDDTDYRLGVETLQIQYDQFKDEVERTTQLFGEKSVSDNDYEKAVAGLRVRYSSITEREHRACGCSGRILRSPGVGSCWTERIPMAGLLLSRG